MLPEGRHLHLVVDEMQGVAFLEQESSLVVSPAPVGLALLLPGLLAYRLGRMWLASIFATSAFLSFICHVVESNVVASPWASLGPTLRLLDGGSVYFCLLQLGFVVIGPEEVSCELGDASRIDWLAARVLPAIAMLVFLSTRSSWPDFHWQSMILLDVLWLLGFTVFWFQPARRAMASEVLLRTHYWLRIWKQALLPTAILSIFVAALQATLVSQAVTAGRTVFALLAARVISAGHAQGEKLRESQRLQELQGLSPSWNPMVARQLLGAPGVLGILTVIVSLVADLFTARRPWPLLSRPLNATPGGYLVVLGALPSLLAMAAALWLVSSTVNCSIFDPEEISLPKEVGSVAGYVSIALGLVTLLLHCFDLPALVRVVSLIFCLGFMVIAVLGFAGTAFSSTRCRCLCISTIVSTMILSSFIVMLLLDQQLIPNNYDMPRKYLACTEYLSVAAYLLWPLAWAREVHSNWQLHKAWPSKPIQMA